MEKWIKLRLSQNSQKIDYAVQLSACTFRFEDGQIERIYVNGAPCMELVDGSDHAHDFTDWNCESLEEFELQAMLNNCIFGLSEVEEGAVKDALDGVLMKLLKAAKEKIRELSNDNCQLRLDVDRKKEILSDFENEVYDLYMTYWKTGDWEDPETMHSLMSDFADILGVNAPNSIEDWRRPSRKANDTSIWLGRFK